VLKQVRAARRAGLYGVQQIEVDESDPLVVNIAMEGAPNTPFEGRQLFLSLTFPSSYPAGPPRIAFQHPLYHPNVYKCGKICWSDNDNTGSSYSLEGIIGMVNTLLATPKPDSPANRDAAKLYVRDKEACAREARKQAEDVLFRL
jgi:ubiquitin-protein ligase